MRFHSTTAAVSRPRYPSLCLIPFKPAGGSRREPRRRPTPLPEFRRLELGYQETSLSKEIPHLAELPLQRGTFFTKLMVDLIVA